MSAPDLFEDPTVQDLATELAGQTGVFGTVDGAVHGWRGRVTAALDTLAQARTARDAARRVREYPRDHLAGLERQVERAKTAATAVGTALANAADDRARRTAIARTDHLNAALGRPASVEQVADRLDLQDARSYLRSLDPVVRTITLKRAAQDGDRPALVRAALSALEPLVTNREARELRERIIARRAPETVREAFAVRQLKKLGADLDLAIQGYTPASLAKPVPVLRDGPGGVKILDA